MEIVGILVESSSVASSPPHLLETYTTTVVLSRVCPLLSPFLWILFVVFVVDSTSHCIRILYSEPCAYQVKRNTGVSIYRNCIIQKGKKKVFAIFYWLACS